MQVHPATPTLQLQRPHTMAISLTPILCISTFFYLHVRAPTAISTLPPPDPFPLSPPPPPPSPRCGRSPPWARPPGARTPPPPRPTHSQDHTPEPRVFL